MLSFFLPDFPARCISLMPQQSDLYVLMCLFPQILKPIGHMLKRTTLRYIEYNESTVHIAIMAASLINNFMVSDR